MSWSALFIERSEEIPSDFTASGKFPPPVLVLSPATRSARQPLYWWRLDTPSEGAEHEFHENPSAIIGQQTALFRR